MERYWVSNDVLLNLSDRLGEALPRDKFTPMVKAADAQATIAALQARVKELEGITKVICGHCCEPMEIPSKAVLQSQLTQRTAELERVRAEHNEAGADNYAALLQHRQGMEG